MMREGVMKGIMKTEPAEALSALPPRLGEELSGSGGAESRTAAPPHQIRSADQVLLDASCGVQSHPTWERFQCRYDGEIMVLFWLENATRALGTGLLRLLLQTEAVENK